MEPIEKEIKEMLKDIIDNGAEYEYRYLCHDLEAHVIYNLLKENGVENIKESSYLYYTEWKPYKLGEAIHEDWEYRKVEKKTWLEETCEQRMNYEKDYLKEKSIHIYSSTKYGIKAVCKKILAEFQDNKTVSTNDVLILQEIIKNLGIEV